MRGPELHEEPSEPAPIVVGRRRYVIWWGATHGRGFPPRRAGFTVYSCGRLLDFSADNHQNATRIHFYLKCSHCADLLSSW